jgi:hypothetical protein
MSFTTGSTLDDREYSGWWEAGVGPNVVVVNEGKAKMLATTNEAASAIFRCASISGIVGWLGQPVAIHRHSVAALSRHRHPLCNVTHKTSHVVGRSAGVIEQQRHHGVAQKLVD